MSDTITEDEIQAKLAQHYGGAPHERTLVKSEQADEYQTVGSVVYSLNGSPPKGYAIYIRDHRQVNLYDGRGKRFRILRETTVKEVEDTHE